MIQCQDWAPADGIVLEPNADAVVRELTNNVAVTAGPGAGKTELLAQRADFLLRTQTTRYPQRILAISFKVDAAANLRDRIRRRSGAQLALRVDSLTFHAFAKRIVDKFRPYLAGDDALDKDYEIGQEHINRRQITFPELLSLALQILEQNETARRALQLTYSHVFLDEFQDCTNVQYKLVRAAFGGANAQLTAVGDTKQKIMGWAGAFDGIFIDYARDFDASATNLFQNYRSAPVLRRVQNRMVNDLEPSSAVSPALLAGVEGEAVGLDFPTSEEEAKEIARLVHGQIAAGMRPAEIAVLVRQQNLAGQIQSELSSLGLPFRDESRLQDLSAEPAGQLVFDIARCVTRASDPSSYRRLLSIALDSVHDESREYTRRAQINGELEAWRDARNRGDFDPSVPAGISAAIRGVLNVIGPSYVTRLSPDYEHGTRLATLIDEAIAYVIGELSTRMIEDVLVAAGADNGVRIMTVHKSKGLEFDTVYMPAIETQAYWGSDAAEVFFVGISRAKRRLVLTYALDRARPEGVTGRWDTARTPYSRFLGYLIE